MRSVFIIFFSVTLPAFAGTNDPPQSLVQIVGNFDWKTVISGADLEALQVDISRASPTGQTIYAPFRWERGTPHLVRMRCDSFNLAIVGAYDNSGALHPLPRGEVFQSGGRYEALRLFMCDPNVPTNSAENSEAQSSNTKRNEKIKKAKQKCEQLGFKKRSDKILKCALDLYKEDDNL